MHLYVLCACFALMFCILSYSFIVSTKNLDLDSEYELWLAMRKKRRGCDKMRRGRSGRRLKRWHHNRQRNAKLLVFWICSRHCGEVVETTVKKVGEYLNMVVDEVRWSNRLNHYNPSPRDPLPRLYAHYLDGRWPWVAWGPGVG